MTAVITLYHGHGKTPTDCHLHTASGWYTLPVEYFPILLSSCLAILSTYMTAMITLIQNQHFGLADRPMEND